MSLCNASQRLNIHNHLESHAQAKYFVSISPYEDLKKNDTFEITVFFFFRCIYLNERVYIIYIHYHIYIHKSAIRLSSTQ